MSAMKRMCFADARRLLTLCVEHDIISSEQGGIIVYREASADPAGYYLDSIDEVAQELMTDEDGQKTLINALAEKGVSFDRYYENTVFPMMDKFLQGGKKSNV